MQLNLGMPTAAAPSPGALLEVEVLLPLNPNLSLLVQALNMSLSHDVLLHTGSSLAVCCEQDLSTVAVVPAGLWQHPSMLYAALAPICSTRWRMETQEIYS